MFDLPTPLRLALQFALWIWVVPLPGLFVARWLLRKSEVASALLVALTLGFGLLVVPTVAHVVLYLLNQPLTLPVLLACATIVNGVGFAATRRGRCPVTVRPDGPLLWVMIAALAIVYFVTADGRHPVASIDHWKVVGTVSCFMEGLSKYLGIHSHAHLAPAPGILSWQHIDEKLTMANLLPTGAHVVLFGAPGMRILRALLAVVLGLTGWILWEHVGGPRRAAVFGLLLFGANPLVFEVSNLDRNVLALTFAGLLYVLADKVRAGPACLGLTAGFTAGLGIRMLPVVYLLPLAMHLWFRRERRLRDLVVLVSTWTITAFGSAFNFLSASLHDYSNLAPLQATGLSRRLGGFRSVESFSYPLPGGSLSTHYPLAFPLGEAWVRGPHSPFPLFLFWPMHVYRALGGVLLALALVGAVASWRESKQRTLTLAAWGLPSYLVLCGLAFLIEPLQERLILVGLLPILVFTVKGVAAVRAVPRARIALGVACIAIIGSAWGATFLAAPLDPRAADENFLAYWVGGDAPSSPSEADAAKERAQLGAPRLLPNYSDWAEQEEAELVPETFAYEQRYAAFDSWTDFSEPDLVGRCFLCDRTGARVPSPSAH